ncbi:hypothetical protein [Lactiplantibacillus mudanjiangensis]|uniref:Uncharacterized protein n=1 Tax=Lactiplantibacillus mudanjiangensis TaxID=1296538 RepID=A0A660E3Y5_9LACO|nr:hypothetical protein [Lactiplantibacillus mudanjiangensis]VDG20163.1 hypothetical protein [Lactobacillus plantarum WCFS1] [Lactiplantibacillus mudanjiangensis]VDG24143.1 hypothetical protein [Lactobacillus plantarum WCFS1] [Lactiplantibacillus mudanjiangensis]VDG30320.1 hypothetical protein [Lactobacillus plantarum WCFS1] [Lactiplantibacillus mudanjiangensis]VDG33559.1 hypothetical protein [Lactobacillus plantarum WCFS1] [Lactiplantibacillus mudanjiangensis]
MIATSLAFLVVLVIGILLSGVFFRYMDATAGVSFGSIKLTGLRTEFLNIALMIGLLILALMWIH